MKRHTAIPGHGLLNEGAPFMIAEDGQTIRRYPYGTSGYGRGVCRCGEMSDLLHSAGQRRRWHAAHKASVASDDDPKYTPKETP